MKFNSEQLLFEAFFFIQHVFLAALSHKLNVIFHISTYNIWEFSNPTDASAENVTLSGGFTELAELNYLCIYTLYYFAEYEPHIVIMVHKCVQDLIRLHNIHHIKISNEVNRLDIWHVGCSKKEVLSFP